ncbi:hypothetical protein PCASD_13104 [Puccinia coronata f. sp. avenae]|uniref:Uncharacterized protein n=1 Tax=Puccinia coronata f. sp. avenae TaxID=200324 RepID=A0A2N5U8K9_9BASI|nr:hypothetical protein PCASD_13104 [Puccinia coronata f. sp. avenae]
MTCMAGTKQTTAHQAGCRKPGHDLVTKQATTCHRLLTMQVIACLQEGHDLLTEQAMTCLVSRS